jgi:hypothetical protein
LPPHRYKKAKTMPVASEEKTMKFAAQLPWLDLLFPKARKSAVWFIKKKKGGSQ